MTDTTDSLDSAPELRIEITPRPTEDERDALVAVLATVLAAPVGVSDDASADGPPLTNSRWSRAGREAAFAARDLRMRRSRQS